MECNLIADNGDAPPNEIDSASSTPFSDMLDKMCAYWMLYGVPYDVFWDGDYTQLKYYLEKHKLEVEQRNQELWMQGLYVYEAVSAALSRAFEKHSKAQYPDKPHRLTPLSEEEKEEEKKRKVEEFRNQLLALCGRMERKHNQEKRENDNKSVVIADDSG